MADEIKTDIEAAKLQSEVAAMGGPREKLSSRALASQLDSIAKSRTSAEGAMRDAAASFYRKRGELDSVESATIIALIGPYVRAYRPTDAELAELLKDTNPRNQVMPLPVFQMDKGNLFEQETKAKPSSIYRQYPAIWRDMSDVEYGNFERKKWASVGQDVRAHIATVGVDIDGRKFQSPVTALESGCTLWKTHRAFMAVLKPRVVDLDAIDEDQEAEARKNAAKLQVAVKLWNEEKGGMQKTNVGAAANAIVLTGTILGLLDEAARNGVMLLPEQCGSILGALDKIEDKSNETTSN